MAEPMRANRHQRLIATAHLVLCVAPSGAPLAQDGARPAPDIVSRLISLQNIERTRQNLRSERQEAASSSFYQVMLWELDGAAAASDCPLLWLIDRLCVEACNEYGWLIPFDRITVHASTDTGPAQAPPAAVL